MEKPPPGSKKRITVFITLMIVVIVVLASYFILLSYFRALTLDEVLNRQHWKAGESRDLEGIITGVQRINTSYGAVVMLDLQDEEELCDSGDVLGDVSRDYSVGDKFRTTLHFSEYWFNDGAGVWSSEIVCPMPAVLMAIDAVIDAVSNSAGMRLQFSGYNQSGWAIYDIHRTNSTPIPLDKLNITLMKARRHAESWTLDSAAAWIVEFADEYVKASGYFPMEIEIDYMDSASNVSSQNGLISFKDMNNTGLIDSEDKLLVKIDPTGLRWRFDTYFLIIGHEDYSGPVGLKYIVNGPDGVYEWHL